MSPSCPHCLEAIPRRRYWRAFVPSRDFACDRCASRLRFIPGTHPQRLLLFCLATVLLLMISMEAFNNWPTVRAAMYMVTALSAAMTLRSFAGFCKLRVVRAAGRFCYRCGYDLTSNTSGICPECGHYAPVPIDWRQFHDEPLPPELVPPQAAPLAPASIDGEATVDTIAIRNAALTLPVEPPRDPA